jgi:hypothetical protein
MAVEGGPEGLADPGPMPTTATHEVAEDPTTRAALRAARVRIEQLRSAVIAARELAKMVGQVEDRNESQPEINWLKGLAEAARYWQATYDALADPPLAVEVEEDDDEEHEPVETAYSVREEEHTVHVFLRTDGSLEREIGTIGSADDLPILLHLVADEMVKTRS